MDLTDSERSELTGAIAAMSRSRERDGDFDSFTRWAASRGPFDTIVDGANVGMYGQNGEGAAFSFAQVEALMAELRAEQPRPGAPPPLLVLHERRLRGGAANGRAAGGIIRTWRQNSCVWGATRGCAVRAALTRLRPDVSFPPRRAVYHPQRVQ